ncbi:PREDICTED: alpha-tocopherol transfer protein-like [Ceratosolen solmsi marchali]|uniref:Alpha-tocopherol transfer protein-like n=1 Tax=Ceratosolen solmsi marchali TaxID=326594 RepID=A0AAJ7DYY3_9HYME|nr:PREDICTED: alpha-tocopherol transfer protein-like [Ceratosolen solmsi marchali]
MTEESSTHLCELTTEQKEFAAAYLNETEALRLRRIQDVRTWILEDSGISSRLDDFFILRFLRGCKFDIEKTKRKLMSYYVQRSLSPEWFTNRDPFLPEIQELLNLGVFLPLRKVDEEGRMVIIIRTCVHDPRRHKIADVFKTGMMVLDLAAREHIASSLYGIVSVHDMTGVQLSHALQMTPGVVKKLVHTWQGYPNRIRSLEYINAPAHVNIVLNIFKRFMSKKLRQRMHVHRGDDKALLKKLSSSILPSELGGTEEDYDTLKRYWKQEVETHKQWFIDDEQYKLKNKSNE